MSKRAIGILYVLGVLFELAGVYGFLTNSGNYSVFSQSPGFESEASYYLVGTVVGIGMVVLGGIFWMIAWIGALLNLSRAQQWAWFVLMFFFSGIMLLIYLIGGPQPLGKGQVPHTQQPLTYPLPNYPSGVPSQLPPAQVYSPSRSVSALEILQQRYARGEIDTATFDEMRTRLEQ